MQDPDSERILWSKRVPTGDEIARFEGEGAGLRASLVQLKANAFVGKFSPIPFPGIAHWRLETDGATYEIEQDSETTAAVVLTLANTKITGRLSSRGYRRNHWYRGQISIGNDHYSFVPFMAGVENFDITTCILTLDKTRVVECTEPWRDTEILKGAILAARLLKPAAEIPHVLLLAAFPLLRISFPCKAPPYYA